MVLEASTPHRKEAIPSMSQEEWKEWNEGLQIIRRINPLLSQIIEKRDLQLKETPGQLSVDDSAEVAQERARIEEWQKKWTEAENADPQLKGRKEYSDFAELLVVVGGSLMHWGGGGSRTKKTELTDDVMRKADYSELIRRSVNGEVLEQQTSVDISDSAPDAAQKVTNSIRFINLGYLSWLRFAQPLSDSGIPDSRSIKQEMLPHFVEVMSHKRAAELALLIDEATKTGDWQKVVAHPIQYERLTQKLFQARAYRAYARQMTEEDLKRDFKTSPIPMLPTTLVNDGPKRDKIIAIFDRCVSLFESALEERERVRVHHDEKGGEELRAMLENYRHHPDVEHMNFISIFKYMNPKYRAERKVYEYDPITQQSVERTGNVLEEYWDALQYGRFRALLTAMPPVKFNDATQQKEPIQIVLKSGEKKQIFVVTPGDVERTLPRFSNLLAQRNAEKVPPPDASHEENDILS